MKLAPGAPIDACVAFVLVNDTPVWAKAYIGKSAKQASAHARNAIHNGTARRRVRPGDEVTVRVQGADGAPRLHARYRATPHPLATQYPYYAHAIGALEEVSA